MWGGKSKEQRALPEQRGVTVEMLSSSPAVRGPNLLGFNPNQAGGNSIVAACMRYSLDNITEPPMVVQQPGEEGFETVTSKGFEWLMSLPMGAASEEYNASFGRMLEMFAWSMNFDGNAYWLEIESKAGKFVGYMSVSHNEVNPVYDTNRTKIEGYRIGGKTYPADKIVHFKRGIDPNNPLLGYSTLKANMRPILTDNEIMAYQHAVVKSPVPSVMIVIPSRLTEEERESVLERAKARFGGENRGDPFIADGDKDVRIESIGWSPADIAIDKLSRLPEERITAAFGIPAMVIGVGAGLERSTYDNYRASQYFAVVNHLDPLWKVFEETVTRRVLPKVDSGMGRKAVFDRSKVRALKEDENALYKRVTDLWKTNGIDRERMLKMLGLPFAAEDSGVFFWMLGPVAGAVPPMDQTRSMTARFGNLS